ncbi:MAG: hypothetical protein ISS69_10310 [Phycisphaerae bacterium]|nr:hypothetical protein [Phycisphaerae bacterium]
MKRLLSSRFLPVAIILIVGVVLLAQNMGIASSRVPAETSTTDPTLAASPAPQMDWALAGLLTGGALITLLRPRRRKIVHVTAK